MALAPGARLGPFEVTALLGEGGMGAVYRAHDAKLKRDVAIKVLLPEVAGDPERLARFGREAQVLASLNHPNIAHIYGLEEAPAGPHGLGSPVRALVMELVDGATLAEVIAHGQLAIPDALAIARQIADALQAAHDQGIIHRDLKPANIKVRSDGTVKVLDFGLAKALGPAEAGPNDQDGRGVRLQVDLTRSPTITTPAMTQAGMILGTAAYMSPEQAKGKPVDKRADVWAFGCVLYEMLAGRRPFEGEDVSDTLAAVLRGEPDWSALPASTPPAVTTCIKRCLERDVKRRVVDVSTVRFVLDDHHLLSSSPIPAAAPDPSQIQSRIDAEVTQARRQVFRRRVAPLAIALVVAVGVLSYGLSRLRTTPPAPVLRFAVPTDTGQLITTLVRPMLAVSPDGSQVAYLAGGQILVRSFSDFETRTLAASDLGGAISSPVFSPDGQWIAYYSGSERAVMKVEIRGGASLRVCTLPRTLPFGLTWDASGILVGLGPDGIARCNPSGGAPEVLVQARDGETLISPSLLPNGDWLLFSSVRGSGAGSFDKGDVVAQSLGTGTRRVVLSGGSDPKFIPTGHLLYSSGGILFAVPLDQASQTLRGDPVPMIEGIRRNEGLMSLSVSTSGTVAYIPGPTGNADVVALGTADRAGVVVPLPLPSRAYTHVRASPDGRALAIGTEDEGQAIIWVYPLGGNAPMQRLSTEGSNRFPIWSPDGRFVAFQSDRGGQRGIFRQRADGAGGAQRLATSADDETHVPESWSPDGRYLSFSVKKRDTYSLWILDVDSQRATSFDEAPSVDPRSSAISPDGKWIAFVRAPTTDLVSPERGVFIRPFPRGDGTYQAPRQGVDFHPVWSRDGRELITVASATAGQMTAMQVTAAAGVTFGAPTRFASTVTGDRISTQPRAFDILPDGRFVGLITDEQNRRTVSEIRVVVNWFEDVKARAPVR